MDIDALAIQVRELMEFKRKYEPILDQLYSKSEETAVSDQSQEENSVPVPLPQENPVLGPSPEENPDTEVEIVEEEEEDISEEEEIPEETDAGGRRDFASIPRRRPSPRGRRR